LLIVVLIDAVVLDQQAAANNTLSRRAGRIPRLLQPYGHTIGSATRIHDRQTHEAGTVRPEK
jgi:hypothetical protein